MSDQTPELPENSEAPDEIISLQGMYQDYFLDYASYVILERAVPAVLDGLKPVQRRILHAMKEMDDGRYNKVANIIGQTMQYHPHGDAAIGDALVNMGQKELLIDTQGNWGNILTGDGAAASRYIEARPTKFALEIAFNPQTTEWQLSGCRRHWQRQSGLRPCWPTAADPARPPPRLLTRSAGFRRQGPARSGRPFSDSRPASNWSECRCESTRFAPQSRLRHCLSHPALQSCLPAPR